MRRACLLFAVCLLLVSPLGAAQKAPYLDLDFELPECSTFWGTQGFTSLPFEHAFDSAQAQSGQQSLRVRQIPSFPYNPQAGRPYLAKTLDPALVAGKHVKLGAYIRTEGMTVGYAGLFWVAFGPSGTVFAELPPSQAATGTSPWTRYELEVDLPADITSTFLALEMAGNGTVWFDNLSLEVDGHPLKQESVQSLAGPPPGFATWLGQRAVPLEAGVAGSGFADLQALKPVIGDARIVSLGEGTHGTREFFQMKHRLLEFLVEEMGFTHFAMEAAMPEARRINDYVLTGAGDPALLIRGLRSWPWNTQEVLDLVLWMRQYNASGKGPVQFGGFDMLVARGATDNLWGFLLQAEPGYLSEAAVVFNRMLQVERTARATAADLAAARGLFDHVSAKRQDYLAAGFSVEQVDWMVQNARILVQLCDARSTGGPAARDRYMAENAGWILDHAPAGSKIVLWSHNGHAKKTGGAMGQYLAQAYGGDMYTVGFTLGEGTFNSQNITGLRPFEAVPAPPSSVEGLLAATGIPRFFVDLRSLGDNGPARWFHEERLMRSLGTPVIRCGFFPVVAASDFDGLIYIERSTPSVLLPFN